MTKEQDTGLLKVLIPLKEALKNLEEMMKEKSKKETIERGKFNLNKMYGPDTYADVAKQIESNGLLAPTMAETVSLVHDAFFGKMESKYQDQIKKTMKDRWFWTDRWFWAFTGILYIPNKGAYIQDNPEIINGDVWMEESGLVKKLQENDKSVRFVSFGYPIEFMTPYDFEKNSFVIGLAGKEGARKLAEVAGKYKKNPYVWSFKSVDEPTIRVSTVDSDWGDCGLSVDGNNHGDIRGGYAFGVQKNAGGASPR